MTTNTISAFDGHTDKARDEALAALAAVDALHALLQAIDRNPQATPLPSAQFEALYAAVVDIRSATRGWREQL